VRVLVTGAGGFVGRAVVRNLVEHGHAISALARGRFDVRRPWSESGVMEPDELDGVIHLAARATVRDSWAEAPDYFLTNVGGTAHLLNHFGGVPVRVVFASTSAVYGSGLTGALSEDLPVRPGNPYAASKAAAEQLLEFQARAGGIGATVLRLFNVAGGLPGVTDPDKTRIITNCLRAAAGEIPHVTVNGDGEGRREFTHVADVADAFRLAVESTMIGETRTFNVGTGIGVSIAEVIDTAKRVTGVDFKVVHNPPVDEPAELVADPSRAADELGWRASATLEQVVDDAWRYRQA
jgi:UDP-glucose 4-epimerase